MPFFDPIRIGASGAVADFTVDRSLRFNDGDSPNLSRTPSGDGNKKKWTWSSWIKISANGTLQTLFSVRSGNRQSTIFLKANGQLQYFSEDSGGTTQANLKTDALLRDPSAWYHVVVHLDAANTTGKIYLNGVEQSLEVSTAVVNTDHNFNTTLEHLIGNEPSQSNYFDGYMAEINFIDGQALTPSSFGETNSTTGQWVPINTSGLTFGTNGFRLKFADNSGTTATTLGKDTSGNGHNFTPNNFSVSAGAGNDSVEDTPTNNFCTLNPLFINGTEAAGTFSEGNLKVVTSGSEYGTALSTFSIRYGKYYWEVKQLGGSFATHGIVRGTSPNADCFVGYDPNGKLFGFGYNQGGTIKGAAGTGTTSNASLASSLATFTTNDIIGFASDISNGTLAIYKNNTLIYTITGINDDDWIPAVSGYTSNGSYSINFGQQAFSYTPPTGYKKLNSANLPDPTILLPNNHFDTLLYTGNNGTQNITGLNFDPDWVWAKNRQDAGYHHDLYDAVRGDNLRIFSSQNNAEQTGYLQFGVTGGFSLTAGGGINTNAKNHVAWTWNAGDTDSKTYTVKVVDDSGNKYRFDDFGTSAVTLDLAEGGTYIFDQSDSSNATHPLRFYTAADKSGGEYTTGVTTSGTAGSSGATVTITIAASAPTLFYQCSSHAGMGGQINTNSTLGSSNFDGAIQSTVKVNASAGFSIVSYTGSGSTTTAGHGLGVAPVISIRKARDAGADWFVHHTLVDGSMDFLKLNTTASNSNSSLSAFTSTVFPVDDNTNQYIIYCFSEVAGYSKFGTYTGNGSSSGDGPFVFLGFRPAWIMIKISGYTGNWIIFDNKRDSFNYCDTRLFANLANADTGSYNVISMLSNGFKLENQYDGSWNRNNTQFVYLAFAESPFKNARAR